MPRDNVDVVKEAFAAWGRRDGDTMRELFHADGEFRSAIVAGIEGGVYRYDDVERNFSDLDEAFEDWHTEDERFLDVGGNKVVVLYRIIGKGKSSGVPIDSDVGLVFTLRDGKITLGKVHLNSQDALRAGFAHSFSLFGADDIDAAVANLDPDIEWVHQPGTGAPEEGVYNGREKVRSLLERLRDAWDRFSVDVSEVDDRGNEFLVKGVIHARGRISDIELDSDCEYLIEFRDSKAVRIKFLTSVTPFAPSQEAPDAA